MKASQLISELQALVNEYGDREIEVNGGWINVYRDRDTGTVSFGAILYASREEAEEVGKTDVYYAATAKIEWEE